MTDQDDSDQTQQRKVRSANRGRGADYDNRSPKFERALMAMCEEEFVESWGEPWLQIGKLDAEERAGSAARYLIGLAERIEQRRRYARDAEKLYDLTKERIDRLVTELSEFFGAEGPGPNPAAMWLHGMLPNLKDFQGMFPSRAYLEDVMRERLKLTESQLAMTDGRAAFVRACLNDKFAWPPLDPADPRTRWNNKDPWPPRSAEEREGPSRPPTDRELATWIILVGLGGPASWTVAAEGAHVRTANDAIRDEEKRVSAVRRAM